MRNALKLFGLMSLLLLVQVVQACSSVPVKDHKHHEQAAWLKPGILNSQRIEAKFGSYGVEQIAQANPELRFSNLFSLNDGVKFARTIALTQYISPRDESLVAAHNEIMSGGSIGVVLVKHGFAIKKDIFFVDEVVEMPTSVAGLMRSNAQKYAAIIYDLSVEKDGRTLPYCTILEVYHPDFLTIDDVKQLYKPTTTSKIVETITVRPDQRAQEMVRTLREGMPSVNI